MLYLQLCSSTQQRQKDINALWKEREEVSPLVPSDTGWVENADTRNGEVIHLQQDQPHNQDRPHVIPGLIALTLLRTVLETPLLMLRLFHK